MDVQAIVLAGGLGSRLHPLADAAHPKALLNIANRPLLHYPLDMLSRAGFTDILVLALDTQREAITQAILASPHKDVELVFMDDTDGCESADALRHIRDKIKTDFLVVSTDVVTDLPVHHMVDLHRSKDATVTSLVYETPKGEDGKRLKVDPGLLEYIGLDPSQTRLLYLVPAADLDDELTIRTSLLTRFPAIDVYTNLTSAHMYIFKKWVIDLIAARKTISSIHSDLIPLLLKSQARPTSKSAALDLKPFIQPSLLELACTLSTSSRPHDKVICCAYYYNVGYTARANTLSSYAEVNRQICKGACPPFVPPERVDAQAEISSKTQVGTDSMVGEGSRVGDRCSIKKAIIGKHCTIGKNVKINNSVLMDYVTIQDNCKLDGTIVCSNAYIHENASLKDSTVGYSYTVPKDANIKNEALVAQRQA